MTVYKMNSLFILEKGSDLCHTAIGAGHESTDLKNEHNSISTLSRSRIPLGMSMGTKLFM